MPYVDVSAQPPPDSTALGGLLVVDLTHFESGSVATQVLGWLGAEVIKVERTGDDPGRSNPAFHLLQCNKQSISIDLKQEAGKEVMRRLLAAADVFVENRGPGALARLGLDYDATRALNPRLIYASIKGFGPTSPYRDFLAYDPVAQATGGAMSVTGTPEGAPMRSGLNLGDSSAGLHAVIGILAALEQRHRTGEGQRVEIAMQDAVIAFGRTSYTYQYTTGEPTPRVGNAGYPGQLVAPSNAYPCAPGGPNDWCFVHCQTDAEWERVLEVIERPDLRDDPIYQTGASRFEHREAVDHAMRGWTMQRTKREVMERMGSERIPAGEVLATADLVADPDLRARQVFVAVDHPALGETVIPGWPVVMSESFVPVTPPPALGEHRQAILERFGYSAAEIDRLVEQSVT